MEGLVVAVVVGSAPAAAAAAEVAGAAGTGCEVGEEDVWPLVWGAAASPFTSAIVKVLRVERLE
jgi:hypothetical protein